MQTVTPEFMSGKKVLLRLDIDVPLGKQTDYGLQSTAEDGSRKTEDIKVLEDFRLKAGLPTLELCLHHAKEVIIMGHIGRPKGEDPNLSVAPIVEWLEEHLDCEWDEDKLKVLENLRFESGEEEGSESYAQDLAALVDPYQEGEGVYINESFAAYRPAASTTVLPKLLPHAAGLKFAQEVEKLTQVRNSPKRPLVVIMGGAKVEDKLPVILEMAKIADYVLAGGKIAGEIKADRGPVSSQPLSTSSLVNFAAGGQRGAPLAATPSDPTFSSMTLPNNVLIASLNEQGTDITQETVERWMGIIAEAKMIVWNGPLGYVENPENDKTQEIASLIVESKAESIVGGGDTVAYLNKVGLLEKFDFVSTGGGAMLKLLETGTLPTIEAMVR